MKKLMHVREYLMVASLQALFIDHHGRKNLRTVAEEQLLMSLFSMKLHFLLRLEIDR